MKAPHQSLRRHTRGAQCRQSCVAVSFCEPAAVFTHHERHVREPLRGKTQCAVEQKLSRSGSNEIVAANDVSDAIVCIIDDHGELICRRTG